MGNGASNAPPSRAAARTVRSSRTALAVALAEAARDDSTFLHQLPTLGPLQLVTAYVRGATSGVVSTTGPGHLVRSVNGAGVPGELQFAGPCGCCTLTNGQIAVADTANRRLALLNSSDLSLARSIALTGRRPRETYSPIGVCVDLVGDIVVSEVLDGIIVGCSNRVEVLDADTGVAVRTLLLEQRQRRQGSGFVSPYGVAVSSCGEHFVTENRHHCLLVFAADGTFSRKFGEPGRDNGQLLCTRGVCTTADDDVIVVDTGNARVQVFRADGTFVRSIGSSRDNDRSPFREPSFVTTDNDGNIIVSDSLAGQVQVRRGDGTWMRSIGGGAEASLLSWSEGVAVTPAGQIVVCNALSHTVQLWE